MLFLLRAATSLQHLHLADARLGAASVAAILAALRCPARLRCVDLSGLPVASAECMTQLAALPALESLTLQRCRTTDADASALCLTESAVTDAGLAALTALSSLTRLHLAADALRGLLAPRRRAA